MRFKIWAAVIWVISAVSFTWVVLAASASADPYHDPLHPNIMMGWCPGGGGNLFCDGQDYADGTYWHQTRYRFMGAIGYRTTCNVHGGLLPPVAAPGSCGGEW